MLAFHLFAPLAPIGLADVFSIFIIPNLHRGNELESKIEKRKEYLTRKKVNGCKRKIRV